jgi:hypothetical protein
MIVRINQIESALAEATAGWGAGELRGAIRYAWPENAFIYQVHILDRDEHGRQLETSYVQSQFRRLIPHVVAALDDGGERAVVRFDGSLVEGELLAAVRYLDASERFAMSPIHRLTSNGEPVVASIRLLPTNGDLTKLCADPLLGLERSVRLRVIAVPETMVNPLLDTADTDDERWREILPAATFVLSTTVGLRSLLIWTSRFDPAAAKSRIMQKLLELQS